MASQTAQVFVSSTWEDLQPERKALEIVAQTIREVKFVGMEYFGSRDENTEHASLDEVARSHIYLGIIAGRYGSGITEAEYRCARQKGLSCLIYFKADSSITLDKVETNRKKLSLLKKLKAELKRDHTVGVFGSPEDLGFKVIGDLYRWLTEKWRPTVPPEEAVSTINALHQLPSPARDFTGRQEELDELIRALESGGVVISGPQGLRGVGKTTLALKLAQHLTPRYPDAQFFLDLKGTSETPLSAADAMAHVIHAYNPTAGLPEGEAELGALYRFVLHGQRALLLMDNAAGRDQVEPLIPPESCVMIVTAHQPFSLPGCLTRNLDVLPAEDARKLLLKISPRIGEQADTIARLCGYLPLALRLAASAMAEHANFVAEHANLKVADYVKRLKNAQRRRKFIDASLSLSYEMLPSEMREHWRILAVFPNTFDSAAAAAVWELEPNATQDALAQLVRYNLLEWNETTARYRLHELMRLFADDRLSDDERDKGQRQHASHYLSVLRGAHDLYLQGGESVRRGLVLFDLEWPNIQAGQRWAEEHASKDDAAASLCSNYPNAGLNLFALRQRPRERIRWREVALAAALRLNARNAEGWHLGNLGVAYYELGEFHRAIKFHTQHLAITREAGDRLGEGQALNNLGAAYTSLGDALRAIELHKQALAIFRKIGDRRAAGQALGHLGAAQATLGDLRQAIKFYKQHLDIAREIGDRRGEGQALNNLGAAHADLGEISHAIKFYQQRLSIAKEIGDRRGEGSVLWNMSLAFYELDKRDEAIDHAEAAIKIFEEIEHPSLGMARKRLAGWRRQRKEDGQEE